MPHTLTGIFHFHQAVRSRFLPAIRDVVVYLPPQYVQSQTARFPVLYMHDGQNLFDAATAFNGNEWGLDETAEELIRANQIEPLIIVGIYNTGTQRLMEYTHVRDAHRRGGRASGYARFLVRELKPFIDAEYRTLPGAADTGLGGSSLGGLVSLYIGLKHPDLFGKLAVMSPSIWWSGRDILKLAARFQHESKPRIWLDIGTAEQPNFDRYVRDTADLRDILLGNGWQLEQDLAYLEDEGAGHNEQAWGRRVRHALKFLFPAGARS